MQGRLLKLVISINILLGRVPKSSRRCRVCLRTVIESVPQGSRRPSRFFITGIPNVSEVVTTFR